MPSPFPGMNPYLEHSSVWHDFHESFMPAAREVLMAQVRPRYIVKIDEHIYIHELPEGRQFLGRGDLTVARPLPTNAQDAATATLESPAQVILPTVDIERSSFLEIRDRDSDRVVTVLELLSPANKMPGPDREQYLSKRFSLLNSTAHFVEVDLLRGGPRMPMENAAPCDYCVMVSRVEKRPQADFWPIRLAERLPVIPIPLVAPQPHASLDLQAIVHRLYDAAGYEDYIYRRDPQPPLSPGDADWARQLLPPQAG